MTTNKYYSLALSVQKLDRALGNKLFTMMEKTIEREQLYHRVRAYNNEKLLPAHLRLELWECAFEDFKKPCATERLSNHAGLCNYFLIHWSVSVIVALMSIEEFNYYYDIYGKSTYWWPKRIDMSEDGKKAPDTNRMKFILKQIKKVKKEMREEEGRG